MAKQITLDEMAEILTRLEHPAAETFKLQLLDLGTAMAELIAEALDLDCNGASTEDCLTAAPFWAGHPGQPMPSVLEDFDPEGTDDWSTRAEAGVPARHGCELAPPAPGGNG